MDNSKAERIRELNDKLRNTGLGGMIFFTHGVETESAETKQKIIAEVQSFDMFTADNDPYGEHDFGSFEVEKLKLFWKIDYYDIDQQGGSPDPADPSVTTRVLTIMRRDEY